MEDRVILHQTPLEDIRALIVEAVADQCKKCQLNKPEEPERIFDRKQTAKQFGISLVTLNEYTKNGIVKAVRIGSRVRYRQSDIESALASVVTTASKK